MPIYVQYYILISHSCSDRQSVRNQCYGYSGCERGPNIFKSDAVLHFVFFLHKIQGTADKKFVFLLLLSLSLLQVEYDTDILISDTFLLFARKIETECNTCFLNKSQMLTKVE